MSRMSKEEVQKIMERQRQQLASLDQILMSDIEDYIGLAENDKEEYERRTIAIASLIGCAYVISAKINPMGPADVVMLNAYMLDTQNELYHRAPNFGKKKKDGQ